MTRINAGIPPNELSDKHLLAEHREIKRIPNAIRNNRANLLDLPKEFTLGQGHVRFFYDKLFYLFVRYKSLLKECRRRGFNVTDFSKAWDQAPPSLCGNWEPTPEAVNLIKKRIKDRTTQP